MADKGKKKFKFDLTYDIKDLCKFNDLHKESQSALLAVSGLKPLKYRVDAELDERKWNEKKLKEEAYYGFKMAIIMLDKEVKKCKGNEKDLKKAYDEFLKDAEYGLEKFMKDQESGKADNAKPLKDGKAAMNKLEAVKSNSFDDPRKGAIAALEPLTKKGADKKDADTANKKLTTIKTMFDKSGKAAEEAVDFLMSMAKKMADNKDADQSLKDFGKEVLKKEKVFDEFLFAAHKFNEAFENGIKATEGDELDVDKAKEALKEFEGLSSLEKKAAAAVKEAAALQPKFKKIESKLK